MHRISYFFPPPTHFRKNTRPLAVSSRSHIGGSAPRFKLLVRSTSADANPDANPVSDSREAPCRVVRGVPAAREERKSSLSVP